MARSNKGSASGGSHRPMSIDAMLDMERKEVLALLENNDKPNVSPERIRRSASPFSAPRSPVRSLLDIDEEGPSHAAAASTLATSKASPPRQAPVRSMLDFDAPIAPPTKYPVRSPTPTSPTENALKPQISGSSSRSMSDVGFKSVDFGPRSPVGGSGPDPISGYQFSGIFTHNSGHQLPKRTTQTGKKTSGGSLADALRGGEFSGIQLPGERGRHSSVSGRLGGTKSKSPHNRMAARSRSPAPYSPTMLPPGKVMLGDGQVVDINSAYRRLSDANLAFSSGSLAQLPLRKPSDEVGEGRLIKDYLGPDGEHLESSEDDDDAYSTDDEDRGRKKAPRSLHVDTKARDANGAASSSPAPGQRRQTRSLLAAAEEERSQIASRQPKYQYRSLLAEPEIKITNTSGDTIKAPKTVVHPHTSYDQGPESGAPSNVDSEEEAEVDDIRRAQKLSFSMTNILTQPEAHRAIRIIYRGEYQKIVQSAEDDNQRLRKYLVATDLSDESTHALEWAIGTVLRDGDTLIAIYCVDEETGIVTGDGSLVPDEAKAMKAEAAAINSVTNLKAAPAPANPVTEFRRQSALYFRGESSATPGSSPAPGGRSERSKGDEERRRAVKDITDRVLKLLRKTQLQVRVVVEVLHCKNPKHLITEVIDLVNPTLVVIGSRGRSALKGVILGSFSNYLVTKSSVPVMVARKRLRKQSQYKRTAVRQVNNLNNPGARSLANAKID